MPVIIFLRYLSIDTSLFPGRYPTSCRASLNQIFMDILTAWQETNYNINSLARVQSKVPKYVEEAINLIQENDDQSMELFLDEVFMNIEKAAKRSSQLADLNVTKLEEVADTMTEMANATEEKIGHSLKTTDALQNEREKYEKKKEQTNKKIQELTEKLADLLSLYYNFGLGSVIALTQCSLWFVYAAYFKEMLFNWKVARISSN